MFLETESSGLFVLTEENLKRIREVSRCGVNGIIADVQKIERAK